MIQDNAVAGHFMPVKLMNAAGLGGKWIVAQPNKRKQKLTPTKETGSLIEAEKKKARDSYPTLHMEFKNHLARVQNAKVRMYFHSL